MVAGTRGASMSSLPPFVLFFVGAVLVGFTRGAARKDFDFSFTE